MLQTTCIYIPGPQSYAGAKAGTTPRSGKMLFSGDTIRVQRRTTLGKTYMETRYCISATPT